MITIYVLEERQSFIIKNSDDTLVLYMLAAARATSAAATCFPSAQLAIPPRPLKLGLGTGDSVVSPTEAIDHIALLDGGVYANNPAAQNRRGTTFDTFDGSSQPGPRGMGSPAGGHHVL